MVLSARALRLGRDVGGRRAAPAPRGWLSVHGPQYRGARGGFRWYLVLPRRPKGGLMSSVAGVRTALRSAIGARSPRGVVAVLCGLCYVGHPRPYTEVESAVLGCNCKKQ